ncbi:hypothetical protein WJX73_001931 [Symbiochloris irregularis]|uniref:Secreted protein n=1 Tax=Symbiochloris irregularis TaxID=706552 RepID=A0AAW1NR19_9CHLO
MATCDVARPAALALWVARLGTRCPDPLSLALAVVLAQSAKSSVNTCTWSPEKADERCRAAAVVGFALAAGLSPPSSGPRHLNSPQPAKPPAHPVQASQSASDLESNGEQAAGDLLLPR